MRKAYHSVFIEIQTLAVTHGAEVDGINAITSLRRNLLQMVPSELPDTHSRSRNLLVVSDGAKGPN